MTEHLKKGYERFRERYYQEHESLFHELADGQSPKTMMICCSDSRVVPNILFDRPPGDFFVVRNVANLVPPFKSGQHYPSTSAALEYAVNALRVEQIVILGHSQCGGIRALIEDSPSLDEGSFIANWVQIASNAKDEVMEREDLQTKEEQITACEQSAVKHSLQNLLTYPWIRENIENGSLRLAGCFYDLQSMEMTILDEINKDSLKS